MFTETLRIISLSPYSFFFGIHARVRHAKARSDHDGSFTSIVHIFLEHRCRHLYLHKIEGMNTASQLPFVLQCSIVPVFSNNVCCDWHNFRLVLDCSYALSLPNGSHENACIFWHGRSGIRVTRIWLRMLILVKARS